MKVWLDSALCRAWEIRGKAKLLIGKHLFAGPSALIPANDRDHLKW